MDLEPRYIVLKRRDVNAGLTLAEKRQLQAIELKHARARIDRGAPAALECLVIEADWPEFGPLRARVLKGD